MPLFWSAAEAAIATQQLLLNEAAATEKLYSCHITTLTTHSVVGLSACSKLEVTNIVHLYQQLLTFIKGQ